MCLCCMCVTQITHRLRAVVAPLIEQLSFLHGTGENSTALDGFGTVNSFGKSRDLHLFIKNVTLTLSLVLTSFILPSRPREFGACRPWNWYPRLVDVWHQRRMSHVLQPFFANVSRWLWCVKSSNAFWEHSSHPIVVMFSNNYCNLIYWNNNNNN